MLDNCQAASDGKNTPKAWVSTRRAKAATGRRPRSTAVPGFDGGDCGWTESADERLRPDGAQGPGNRRGPRARRGDGAGPGPGGRGGGDRRHQGGPRQGDRELAAGGRGGG